MVLGPLIAMLRCSIDRTPDPAPPRRGDRAGGAAADAVAGLLSSGSGWNVARLHELRRHSRDVLVPGRLEITPGDRPASREGEPATALRGPGRGSQSTPDIASAGSDGRPAGRAPRILVVDDEPSIHLMSRTTLEADGYEVLEAADGEAALEVARTTPVDLILLDLRMPLLDGLETLRHLRQIGDETPVVIVTAHGTVPDAVEAMKLGAIDLLPKPLTPGDLRRVVSEVLERHAAPDRGPRPATDRAGPSAADALGRPALDLTAVKVAMDRGEFDRATALLDRTLDTHPDAAEALALMGLLLESRGLDHSAYHEYRRALAIDPDNVDARANMRRYCARFGLDADDPRINPAAGR
jgi:DNA-binding response OmpR family regulator